MAAHPDADAELPSAGENPSSRAEVPADAAVSGYFLGPKSEHGAAWRELLDYVFQDYVHWRRNYFPADPVVVSHTRRRSQEAWLDTLSGQLDLLINDLKADYPFYHPRYIAHMLCEQTLPSVLGYFAGMLYNANNVTEEAAPVTVRLELEVARLVAEMLGYRRERCWAHLTSGGTVANLEALWVARAAQLRPLALRDLCRTEGVAVAVRLASGREVELREAEDEALLHLGGREALATTPAVLEHLIEVRGMDREEARSLVERSLRESPYNPARAGFYRAAERLKRRPLIFASAAAHYSIAKACNVLGYGEDAVELVPVTSDFRIDVDALQDRILNRPPGTYVAAVVGVIGTTEEGAVDPLHRIQFMRRRLAVDQDLSFWLHADAAWGGYIASLFRGHDLQQERGRRLADIAAEYAGAIGASENLEVEIEGRSRQVRRQKIGWEDAEVYSAFLALPDADSITVDPHKLGYVPYPAGVVAFRSHLAAELVTQKANYISDAASMSASGGVEVAAIDAVGPYALEGSKPGAAAAACWLAHKSIPLTADGHGGIIKSTLMSAARLARYLDLHRSMYASFERRLGSGPQEKAFTFERLFSPDTNIVCFLARPMEHGESGLHSVVVELEVLNELNERVHERMGKPAGAGGDPGPYGHPFFVSRTKLEQDQYSSESLAGLLARFGIAAENYRRHGLFVLRSTVMNPHYPVAEREAGKDYLMDFVLELHRVTRAVLDEAPR